MTIRLFRFGWGLLPFLAALSLVFNWFGARDAFADLLSGIVLDAVKGS
jgi:hypothetical protein